MAGSGWTIEIPPPRRRGQCPSCGHRRYNHAEGCERVVSDRSANARPDDAQPVTEWPEGAA